MTYEEVQKQLIDRLRVIGVVYPYNTRLDLFWLRVHIPKVFSKTPDGELAEILKDIMNLGQMLVELRRDGKEPEHKDGRYVSLS
jgi:hypothetical protein